MKHKVELMGGTRIDILSGAPIKELKEGAVEIANSDDELRFVSTSWKKTKEGVEVRIKRTKV